VVEAAGVELFNLLILRKLLVLQGRETPEMPLCRVGGTKTVQKLSDFGELTWRGSTMLPKENSIPYSEDGTPENTHISQSLASYLYLLGAR
jgi:hypothetical protein